MPAPGCELPPAQIGVLDLQGGVAEHVRHLQRLGIRSLLVKRPQELEGLAGLIIPGGESTCLGRLLKIFGLAQAIADNYGRGLKIWGTCAGTILLAKEIVGEPPVLALVDITVERNSFGSQLDSFTARASIPKISPGELPLTFIRAPKILRAGPDVEVLLEMNDFIAAAETEFALMTVFHPELTPCLAFHRYFARKCNLTPMPEAIVPDLDPAWDLTSWTALQRPR